jgi:hypothetical protein
MHILLKSLLKEVQEGVAIKISILLRLWMECLWIWTKGF